MTLTPASEAVLARLADLRMTDAPTHGGRVLSYVYDSGLAELDELAAVAMGLVQPVNGLDPTTFPSVAVMEREVVAFARTVLHGDDEVVGNVTSGGTESCLLAVKTARDVWAAQRDAQGAAAARPRLVAPATVHAAFHKAAHYFGLELDLVPVGDDGRVEASALVERLGPDVALVVVSAPAYPHATLDPVTDVAAEASARGIACHVDACIGGWVLPWWTTDGEAALPGWDFAVDGVTSISADLHKFGYAPKGASVLLHRGRDRHRAQYFATKRWPGYPVVNPTMLGSKSAGALAAAWAITQRLGVEGFAELAASCRRATDALIGAVGDIVGLRVVGSPTGPLFAVATDDSVDPDQRVDPHHWADRARAAGWLLQQQPGLTQSNGVRLPHTTHLTITPVTEKALPELIAALRLAADEVRGVPAVTAEQMLGAVPPEVGAALAAALTGRAGTVSSAQASALLGQLGIGADGALPAETAPLLALIESMPAPLTERLLIELLATLVDPRLRAI